MRQFIKKTRLFSFSIIFLLLSGCYKTDLQKNSPDALSQIDAYIEASERLESEGLSDSRSNPFLTTSLDRTIGDIQLPDYKLSVQAEAMDIRKFYMSLVEGTKLNMVIAPSVKGQISFVGRDLPLEDILDLVYEQYGFSWQRHDTGYKISAISKETRTYNISYLAIERQSSSTMSVESSRISASGSNQTNISTSHQSDVLKELASSLDHLISDDKLASYKINSSSGLLVLKAFPKTHSKVASFLKNLNENLHHQVLIEAKILEVELYDSYKQGIDWTSIFQKNEFAAGQVGSGSIVDTGLETSLGSGNSALVNLTNINTSPTTEGFDKFLYDSFRTTQMGGIFKVGLFKNNFKFVLDLLSGQGQVQVLSSPRITTLNNQQAVIRVGEEKKFIKEITPGSVETNANGTVSSDATISFETYFSGISLVVMPHIIDDGSLILHVHPAISKISETKQTYNFGGKSYEFIMPTNDIRETDSVIKVDNRQIVVLGGLMKSEEDKENAFFPVFKKVPALDHRVTKNRKSELVILIKPLIVTADTNAEIIRKQRETLQSFGNYLSFED